MLASFIVTEIREESVVFAGRTGFGPNFELLVSYSYRQDGEGTLCNIGRCENKEDCVMSCFDGPVLARAVTVRDKYTNGITLCEVQVIGKLFL